MDLEKIIKINGHKKDGSEVNLSIVADDTFMGIYKDNPKEAHKYLESLGPHFMFEPSFRIDDSCLTYSPHVPRSSKFNTIVTVHLPYTLHIPNELSYDIQHPFPAFLHFKKQWTSATPESDEFDILAEQKTYVAGQAKLLTPKLPLDPTEGWQPVFTGKNVERWRDTHGTMRYTIMTIEFNSTHDPSKEEPVIIAKEIEKTVLEAINRTLKIYQSVTKEIHVQPLSKLVITDIYFPTVNTGFLPLVGFGIGSAVMNVALDKVGEFKSLLESDFEPDVTELLIANAQWSFHVQNYKMAVIESFIATDVCVENYLLNKHQAAGKTAIEAESEIQGTTKTRLKYRFATFLGNEFSSLHPMEYAAWEIDYDAIRIPVTHKGKLPTKSESESAIKTNEAIMKLVKSLP
ncbi:MAG: hypothetical protein Q7R81_02060 [Candidatus Peregrinibacteria bacterium]|nr:hypothetical protein [Candidatus Peregrinibacteria bacterium]